MFTGLVSAIGTVRSVVPRDGGRELSIAVNWDDTTPGESIAINGACLTVVESGTGYFTVHVVATSLERTRFGSVQNGDRVNLERALRVGDRLGGHMVQGHVDGVGTVLRVHDHADARLIDIAVPAAIASVSIPLGSITVDGVSLTVNAILPDGAIQLSIIPFTLQHTTLNEVQVGDRLHLEGDMVGKYIRHFVAPTGERSL